jgi:hypothetical protein
MSLDLLSDWGEPEQQTTLRLQGGRVYQMRINR